MGAGLMDKLVIQFDNYFWDPKADILGYIEPDLESPVRWNLMMNMYKYWQKPQLLMFNVGDAAREMAELSDEEMLEEGLSILREMYGSDVVDSYTVVDYKRSNWSKDPYA